MTKKMNWNQFVGEIINVTLKENYGVVFGNENNEPPQFYEIVFKTGKLIEVFEDSLLLEAEREGQLVKIWIPYETIKCVEIFNFKENS